MMLPWDAVEPDEGEIKMTKHDRRAAHVFGVTVGCLFTVVLILNAFASYRADLHEHAALMRNGIRPLIIEPRARSRDELQLNSGTARRAGAGFQIR